MVLVRNPNYFNKDKKPYLDEIDVHINSNPSATALSFEQGNTAFMSYYTQDIPAQSFLKWSNLIRSINRSFRSNR